MSTQLPKDKKSYIIIEPTKVTVALFTVLIGLVGWLGKVTYEKLTSIESDVKILLVANGVNKTNIDNLKNQMDKFDPCPPVDKGKKTAAISTVLEFVIPKDTVMSINDRKHNKT